MMSNICRICGSPESGAIANARALGLEQEFLSGIHTCCQIANWADEQSLARGLKLRMKAMSRLIK